MKGFVLGIGAAFVALVCGTFAVSAFGLYPIGADNPPGAVERLLAGRAMDVYADRHKPAGDNPVQVTVASLSEGATEYEEHCAFCHGGAKAKISPMQGRFSPPVPQLLDRIPDDEDAWLFWVTKHGVRMTAMPAWNGVLSDDEIWTIVLFIKHSGALPPEVQSLWRRVATEPGEMDEHTPEQHEPRAKDRLQGR